MNRHTAHEIRNHLQSLKLAATLLEKGAASPTQVADLIKRAAVGIEAELGDKPLSNAVRDSMDAMEDACRV